MPKRMEERPAKQAETSRRFRIRPAYVILVILLALFALKFVQKMQEVRSLQRQTASLRAFNQHLQTDNKQVHGAIRWYHTSQYVEDEARAVFGYTKPGEVAVITRAHYQPVAKIRAAPPRSLVPPQPSWKQWWLAFFG